MMVNAQLLALFASLYFSQCLAVVTWKTVGCSTSSVHGSDMNAMWDNALAMVQQANNAIQIATSASIILPKSDESRAADNTKYMFGTSFKFGPGGMDSASKSLMASVSNVYTNIISLLSNDAGYLICDDAIFTWGEIGIYVTGAYYYTIPGTSNVLVYTPSAGQVSGDVEAPCQDGKLLGKTFNGQFITTENGVTTTNIVNSVLFCSKNIEASLGRGVLPLGYKVTEPKPNPNTYTSAAGVLLHEMVHVVDGTKYLDQTSTGFPQQAYGFNKCAYLALKDDREIAVRNADNYKVFAEMCMSPATRWGAPDPGVFTRSSTATPTPTPTSTSV